VSQSNRPQPYIGVSGFMTRAEVDAALRVFPDCGRLLMVGVLASWKTIFGSGNSKPRRYPKTDDIGGIFSNDPRCLNLIHYGTDDTTALEDQLSAAVHLAYPRCHGVQVNVPWPDARALRTFRARFLASRVVLQVGPRALVETEWDPVKRIGEYVGAVTDVLIDVSAGGGIAAPDLRHVRDIVLATMAAYPAMGVGFAGGLDGAALADNVPRELVRAGASTDVESRVRRNPKDQGGDLDPVKVGAYLGAAGAILGHTEAA
jgi:hypothetical protein